MIVPLYLVWRLRVGRHHDCSFDLTVSWSIDLIFCGHYPVLKVTVDKQKLVERQTGELDCPLGRICTFSACFVGSCQVISTAEPCWWTSRKMLDLEPSMGLEANLVQVLALRIVSTRRSWWFGWASSNLCLDVTLSNSMGARALDWSGCGWVFPIFVIGCRVGASQDASIHVDISP